MLDYVKKVQSIVGTNNDGGRPSIDFYPTPQRGTKALLKMGAALYQTLCENGMDLRPIAREILNKGKNGL